MDKRKIPVLILPAAAIAVLAVILAVQLTHGRNAGQSAADTSVQVVAGTSSSGEEAGSESTAAAVQTTQESSTGQESTPAESDPQQEASEKGAAVDVTSLLSAGTVRETSDLTVGVDVSRYQGTIDWQKVAASGVQFAMIRVGYRTQVSGEIVKDPNAEYNLQQAIANQIKVGVYFFSTAISKEEAVQEADYVADLIAPYQITYPVAYNCEGFQNSGNRQNSLDQTARTSIADAFLQEIYKKGYTPMFYAAKNEMEGNARWDTGTLDKSYKIWVSQYPDQPYPQTAASTYAGTHAMWQYTNNATVSGISKPTDFNVAYFGYAETAAAKSSQTPRTATASAEALMTFTDVSDTVTAKSSVNLRDKPSQGSDAAVLFTLKNGDTAARTGTSSSGWSRLTYQNKTCYAVTSYLTTDLAAAQNTQQNTTAQSAAADQNTAAQTQQAADNNGIKTVFKAANDTVTAKIAVNLRSKPSVTNPEATVVATLKNGENVTRTGISDNGWSRVSYNGQTLYCISSYLVPVS